jgi:hypothetical protein
VIRGYPLGGVEDSTAGGAGRLTEQIGDFLGDLRLVVGDGQTVKACSETDQAVRGGRRERDTFGVRHAHLESVA